ncbi:DUF3888 domain-containing protein [Cytobacillus kochii]|uniref:DUF3888 domain-containing protein n=1 Tax=Cytobacillus kochii TaxID=859143 RepID=UPI001CD576C2|nr:DUF3888 domain-containing protein [Cytobacillus kochii]MCA1024626.1 DUF3888 domain-containing protein [Cytobacillus kochii]MCM3323380.1 DUF3888 domain-containing protein [Cytobacillus kochii]MCM3345775.1 DUF3888 domain-containing protein [Cytobacillus kochii]
MRKFAIFLLIYLLACHVCLEKVHAEEYKQHDAKDKEQVVDHFVLAILNDEVRNAVNDYYQKDTVIQFDWQAKDYNVVEMKQWKKGNELGHSFLISLTVLPYDNNKSSQLGVDTITFGISPQSLNTQKNNKSLASTEVELLDYKHREAVYKGS